jgi:hypothetical protein
MTPPIALREQARCARRLADGLVSQQDRKALIDFAETLEARAVQTFGTTLPRPGS